MKKIAVISLSGGMDSTSLLLHLVAREYDIFAISFDYGQKHKIELQKVKENILFLKGLGIEVEHRTVNMSFLGTLLDSALTNPSYAIPEGHYEGENMKLTVVPNRNAIFSSILYGYALSLSKISNSVVEICLGVHSGDHMIYKDCTPEFYRSINESFQLGNWGGEKVLLYLPYLNSDKTNILKDLRDSVSKISSSELQKELIFKTILTNTNTCYNPDKDGVACGKCGSCVERLEAFANIDTKDPVKYKND